MHALARRPVTTMSETAEEFSPRPSLRGGHRMTLYGWGNPRYFPRLGAATRRYFDVEADARVLAHCHWQARPWEHPTVIALHGLNGSSDAHYMRGIAAKAFARGMNVVRLNQRNCGGTEHLSAGLFHSGLTADARHVIDELSSVDGLPAIAVAGYSLGGNLALKLAGEFGDDATCGAEGGGGGVTNPGNIRVRPRARTAGQLDLSVELRPRPESPDPPQGAILAGTLRSVEAQGGSHGARLRRGLHRAALRLCRVPKTTTTRPAPCGWSIVFACRRSSSPRPTIRSCRHSPSSIRT